MYHGAGRVGIYTIADFLLLKCMVNRSMEERKIKNTCLGLKNKKGRKRRPEGREYKCN